MCGTLEHITEQRATCFRHTYIDSFAFSLSLSFSSSLSFFRQGCSGCQAVVTDTKAWTCPKKNSYSMALMELGKCLGVLTSEFEVIGITSQECTTSCLT